MADPLRPPPERGSGTPERIWCWPDQDDPAAVDVYAIAERPKDRDAVEYVRADLLRSAPLPAEPSEAALKAAERADAELCETAYRPTRRERIAAALRAAYTVDRSGSGAERRES